MTKPMGIARITGTSLANENTQPLPRKRVRRATGSDGQAVLTPVRDGRHPWSMEQHPEWCAAGVGCGGEHTSDSAAVPVVGDEDDEALVAATMTDSGRFVDLVVPDLDGTPTVVRFTPADALNLSAALTAKALMAMAPCRMETRNVDAYRARLAQAS